MRPEIRVSRRFNAPPERVFGAWLDPEVAARWLFATASRPMARAAIDARAGGAFCFAEGHDAREIEYAGRYVEINPPWRLVFTLAAYDALPAATRVVVEFARLGGTGGAETSRAPGVEGGHAPLSSTRCKVTLTHENVPLQHGTRTRARWTGILYGLGLTLEGPAASPLVYGLARTMRPMSKSGPGYRL